jgi:hypothetical protein
MRLGVPRLDADAVEYFSHVRSLYFDHDLDFANEFEHFGILGRGDKVVKTVTGHRRTIFSVGPAVLWMPFYAAGDLFARALGDVEEGYSKSHIRAVCLASLVYGVLGLLLVDASLRRLFPPEIAFWTTLALLYGTFLFWYVANEAAVSHAVSFFTAALVLYLFLRFRSDLTPARAALLGFAIGIAAIVRWQNAVLLVLPGLTLLPSLRAKPRATVAAFALLGGAFVLGALPQMFAWNAIFGTPLLADPPHGRDFLRLDHPYLLDVFFSSRHGLLYWTPLLWGGYLGYLRLLRREPPLAATLLLPLLLMSYVNACSGDWWAGGSFSNRRFDSVLPFLALGLGASFAFLEDVQRRRPAFLLVAGGVFFTASNLLFMEAYRRVLVPWDDTVSFPEVSRTLASLVTSSVGSPNAWPANWVFAASHSIGVGQYDLAVGKYLFYRQNNLGGVIQIGDPRSDPALLDWGWSSPRPCGRETCRGVLGSARILAPLDVAEDLDVLVRAQGSGTLALSLNGRPLQELPLGPALADTRLRAPRDLWHRETNELGFRASGDARVSRVSFLRKSPR